MENKNKKSIIIGITSLLIVTLILLGLTYAYYRTRIIGNDAETSINVTSKKMEITYEDGTAVLSTDGKIDPGFTASKTFYVENTGDQSVNYSIMLEDMNNTFERNQDWTYTLTENGTQIASGTIAVGRHQVLVGSTTIAETTGTKNTYVLTITYANSDEDQSVDMGATLSFRVNITEEQVSWTNAKDGTLLYAIKSQTEQDTSLISSTEDDYGTSYYYNGGTSGGSVNNFVNYSGMCWRIVRIQGDGTIKLILADEANECHSSEYDPITSQGALINGGTTYYHVGVNGTAVSYENSGILSQLSTWATDKNLNLETLVDAEWCSDMSIATKSDEPEFVYGDIYKYKNYYGAYSRLLSTSSPTLKCNMTGLDSSEAVKYTGKLGMLSADEVAFINENSSFGGYLYDNANSTYWTLTPSFDGGSQDVGVYFTVVAANLDGTTLGGYYALRPAIVLKSTTTFSNVATATGKLGSYTNPYVIS